MKKEDKTITVSKELFDALKSEAEAQNITVPQLLQSLLDRQWIISMKNKMLPRIEKVLKDLRELRSGETEKEWRKRLAESKKMYKEAKALLSRFEKLEKRDKEKMEYIA